MSVRIAVSRVVALPAALATLSGVALAQEAPKAQAAAAADTVALSARNESGITGAVVLTAKGDSTVVVVKLKGGTPGTSYSTHIHKGTCAEPGGVVAPLAGVAVGEDGTGASTTTVASKALADAKAAGPLLVQSHLPGGRPATCGALGRKAAQG